MSDQNLSITELDERIAVVNENLRELIEQAAAYSGAADEELASRRIADLEEELALLKEQRQKASRKDSNL